MKYVMWVLLCAGVLLTFLLNGLALASGSDEETTKLLDASSGVLLRTLTGHTDGVPSVAFSPDGETLASGSRDDTIKLWDVSSGVLIRTLTGHTDSVFSAAFSPDGKTLASGSYDDTIKLWDVSTGALIRTLTYHTGSVSSVAFSPDGETLASGSRDDTIKLWDVSTGTLIRTLRGHTWSVEFVAFSPDGKTLASGSGDRTIKLWDVSTGSLIRTLSGHTSYVKSVAFSPDGETLASGSYDDTIKLWDVLTGELIRTLTGHANTVYSVAFSPDGETLASGSWDETIKLWDVSTGKLIRTLTVHTNTVESVAFSPDGETLASSSGKRYLGDSDDYSVRLWDVDAILHPNERPTASFTWQALSASGSRLVVEPRTGDKIEFDASSSSDPDGKIVEYAWDWDSNGSYDYKSSASVIEHSFTSSGSHRVTLRVTDDEGATDTASKTVTIRAEQPPRAAFNFTPSSPSILDTVKFSDTSSDADRRIVSWEWSFGDGVKSTERNPSHQYRESSTFEVTLEVTDNDGLTDQNTQTLIVARKDLIEADFTFSVVDEELYMVSLDASASISTMGEIVRYEWDWDGDGTYDTAVFAPKMTHRFEGEGPHEVILTIVDDGGNKDSCKKEVRP